MVSSSGTSKPQRGLDIHFFTGTELDALVGGFTPVLPRRLHRTPHTDPAEEQWLQGKGIWHGTQG